MKVLVIGAGGRTGRHVVERSLGRGWDVRAFVRESGTGIVHPRLEEVSGDVLDFDAVSAAAEGVDAVVVALGRSASSPSDLYERCAENVLHAMALHGVMRLAVMSTAGAFRRNDPAIPIAFRALIATTYKASYDDREAAERRIMASGVDWAIVRCVGLNDEPATGDYRISLDGSIPRKHSRVSREDVAGLLLKVVESDAYVRRAVVVSG